jgi:hypothetical protein
LPAIQSITDEAITSSTVFETPFDRLTMDDIVMFVAAGVHERRRSLAESIVDLNLDVALDLDDEDNMRKAVATAMHDHQWDRDHHPRKERIDACFERMLRHFAEEDRRAGKFT